MVDFDEALTKSPIRAAEVEPASHTVESMDREGILSEFRITFAPQGDVDLFAALRPRLWATGFSIHRDRHTGMKPEDEPLELLIGTIPPLFMDPREIGAQ